MGKGKEGGIGYTRVIQLLGKCFLGGGRALRSVGEVKYLSIVVNEESPGWVREEERNISSDINLMTAFLSGVRARGLGGVSIRRWSRKNMK